MITFTVIKRLFFISLAITASCTCALYGMTPAANQQDVRRTKPRLEQAEQDLAHGTQASNVIQATQINHLPDEIALRILHLAAHDYEQLNTHNYVNLLGTSHRFRSLLKNPAQNLFIELPRQENLTEENLSTLPPSTKTLNLSYGSSIDYIGLVTTIAKHCPRLTNLNLTGCNFANSKRLTNLAEFFSPAWTGLNLSSTNIDNFNLMITVACCTNLSSLDLSHCSNLSAKGMTEAFALLSPTLTELRLSQTEIDGNGLQNLATHCPRLSVLDMTGCTNITQGQLANIPTTLTHLNLAYTNINDNDLLTIANRCQKLTALHLCGCSKITSAGLATAISQFPETLTTIDLSNTNIDRNGLRTLALRCQNLKALYLCACNNFTPSQFTAAIEHFSPQLTYLCMGNNIDLTGLYALAKLENLACLEIFENEIISPIFTAQFHRLRREHEMKPCYLEINYNT